MHKQTESLLSILLTTAAPKSQIQAAWWHQLSALYLFKLWSVCSHCEKTVYVYFNIYFISDQKHFQRTLIICCSVEQKPRKKYDECVHLRQLHCILRRQIGSASWFDPIVLRCAALSICILFQTSSPGACRHSVTSAQHIKSSITATTYFTFSQLIKPTLPLTMLVWCLPSNLWWRKNPTF